MHATHTAPLRERMRQELDPCRLRYELARMHRQSVSASLLGGLRFDSVWTFLGGPPSLSFMYPWPAGRGRTIPTMGLERSDGGCVAGRRLSEG
jgi:hypothetical protein